MPATAPSVYVNYTQLSASGKNGPAHSLADGFQISLIGGAATSGNTVSGYEIEAAVNDGTWANIRDKELSQDDILCGIPQAGDHYTIAHWGCAYALPLLMFTSTGRIRFRARTLESSGSSNTSAWAYSQYVYCIYDTAQYINFRCTQTHTDRGVRVTWDAEPTTSGWGTNEVVNYLVYYIASNGTQTTSKILAASIPKGTTYKEFTIDDILSPNLSYRFQVDIQTQYGIIEGLPSSTSYRVFDNWEVDN